MLVKRLGDEETREGVIALNDGARRVDDILNITLAIHDLNLLLEQSPTEMYATIKRLRSHYAKPTILGKII